MKRLAVLSLLLLAAAARADSSATAPFTPGPETTLISGPLLPDGTIDYVPAINAELGKGVTSDNNAVPLLMLALSPPDWDTMDRVFTALNISAPPHVASGTIPAFFSFAKSATSDGPDKSLDELALLRSRPWTAADHPVAAKWLDASAEGFKLLEQAADCPRWYYPFVNNPGTTGWLDAMPMGSTLEFRATDALASRAMWRAGAGDFDGARADIQRLRRLSRNAATNAISIDFIVALGMSVRASQAGAALAQMPSLTARQLQALRSDLADPAQQLVLQVGSSPAERMINLDSVMICIRGEGRRIVNPASMLDPAAPFDEGDLSSADWNIVLRDANRLMKEYDAIDALPTFAARKAALAAREPALVALKVPGPLLFDQPDRPFGKDLIEQYLKLRPNESRADYSHRIATLLFDDPRSSQQMNALAEREKVYRRLAQLAVDLADFHRSHHAWPDTLAALHSPIDTTDPFSDKPFVYRTDNDTFTLYSVGINEKDDHAKGDDFTITNAPPPPPATTPAATEPPPPN